jgi:hypothetical protein
LTEEAVMVVAPQGVPVLRHDVREGVRDVAGLDDRSRLAGFPEEEEEGEDDTAEEDPFADLSKEEQFSTIE